MTINRGFRFYFFPFSWAKMEGLATQNSTTEIKPVTQEKPESKSLERLEQQALMKAVQSSRKVRDIALVALRLHTVIRMSEVCSLMIDDVFICERSALY
jgi:site-specific recombinase XerD